MQDKVSSNEWDDFPAEIGRKLQSWTEGTLDTESVCNVLRDQCSVVESDMSSPEETIIRFRAGVRFRTNCIHACRNCTDKERCMADCKIGITTICRRR